MTPPRHRFRALFALVVFSLAATGAGAGPDSPIATPAYPDVIRQQDVMVAARRCTEYIIQWIPARSTLQMSYLYKITAAAAALLSVAVGAILRRYEVPGTIVEILKNGVGVSEHAYGLRDRERRLPSRMQTP